MNMSNDVTIAVLSDSNGRNAMIIQIQHVGNPPLMRWGVGYD